MSQLTLNADTSGFVTLSVATTVTSYTFQWPSAAPATNGALLSSTTAGIGSWTTATFPSTATSTGTILRADGTNWVASTATYPNTSSAGTFLVSATANTITATATPTLGVAGTTAGTLTLSGVTSGTAVLQTAAAAGSFTYTLTDPGVNVNIGYLEVPQNSQSAAYTTVLADSGKQIFHPSTDDNARTFTIPANSGGSSVAYPIGTVITFINQINTLTIAITSDTMTLAGTSTTGSRTLAVNGIATAIKVGSTNWIISGSGLT
jgi:hypothetical protein